MPYALLYRSIATHIFGELSLRALVVRAAERNSKTGVTGVLLYGTHDRLEDMPGTFLQWIEGPEDAVRDLYESITDDPRHQSMEIIAEGPMMALTGSNQRLFPDWNMNAVTLGNLPATLPGFLSHVRLEDHRSEWALAA